MPNVQSVHIPSGMNTISVRGWGRKEKKYTIEDITTYAKKKGVAFTEAYYTLLETAFSKSEDK